MRKKNKVWKKAVAHAPSSEPEPYLVLWLTEDGKAACALDLDTFSQPGVWGVVLADAVEHVVNAYAQQGADPEVVRREVLEFFRKEVENPTDTVVGEIVGGGTAVGDES